MFCIAQCYHVFFFSQNVFVGYLTSLYRIDLNQLEIALCDETMHNLHSAACWFHNVCPRRTYDATTNGQKPIKSVSEKVTRLVPDHFLRISLPTRTHGWDAKGGFDFSRCTHWNNFRFRAAQTIQTHRPGTRMIRPAISNPICYPGRSLNVTGRDSLHTGSRNMLN